MIDYQDANCKMVVVWSGSSFEMEFYDMQEYRDFKGWVSRSANSMSYFQVCNYN
jgi:hypothetical protein